MSLPIITTNVPGCKDIIHNNYSGLLVSLKDKNSLRDAIKFILDNEKLALTFGINARKTVSKNFTTKIINNKILEIYKNSLKKY